LNKISVSIAIVGAINTILIIYSSWTLCGKAKKEREQLKMQQAKFDKSFTKKEEGYMQLFKLWNKASKGRRLNIKRVILFPIIVYAAYLFIDSFIPLFMIGFVIWFLYRWTGKRKN